MIKVTIWNEFRHEKNNEAVAKIYPDGIHEALAKGIAEAELKSERQRWMSRSMA